MTAKTATEVLDQQRHGPRDRLARMTADFQRDFRPEDPHQAYDFDMRYQYIVQLIYDAAAEPYQKILTDSVSLAQSYSKILVEKK